MTNEWISIYDYQGNEEQDTWTQFANDAVKGNYTHFIGGCGGALCFTSKEEAEEYVKDTGYGTVQEIKDLY